jgi:hypothetical protein
MKELTIPLRASIIYIVNGSTRLEGPSVLHRLPSCKPIAFFAPLTAMSSRAFKRLCGLGLLLRGLWMSCFTKTDDILLEQQGLTSGPRESKEQVQRIDAHKCLTVPRERAVALHATSQAEQLRKHEGRYEHCAMISPKSRQPSQPIMGSDQHTQPLGQFDYVDQSARPATMTRSTTAQCGQCQGRDGCSGTIVDSAPWKCSCSEKIYSDYSLLHLHLEKVERARRPKTVNVNNLFPHDDDEFIRSLKHNTSQVRQASISKAGAVLPMSASSQYT